MTNSLCSTEGSGDVYGDNVLQEKEQAVKLAKNACLYPDKGFSSAWPKSLEGGMQASHSWLPNMLVLFM